MSLFRPERRSFDPNLNPLDALTAARASTSYGVPVTATTAMAHTAVHQCVNRIADLVSGFPPDVYRDVDGYPVLVTERRGIIDNPSAELDALNWRRMVVVCWLLRGNAFGLVTGVRNGYPTGITL